MEDEENMKRLTTRLALLALVSATVPAALAQNFKVGDHVEARPTGSDWYPCTVTQGAPNYRVKCTNIDGATSDYVVPTNRLRSDTGQAAAVMASRWAQRFPIGSRVEAAPYGEQNGYHPCTVLSVKGNGANVGIYHLKCDFGYANGPIEVDVGAVDYIRAATHATVGEEAKKQAPIAAGQAPSSARPDATQGGSGGSGVAQGVYQCWSSGRANLTLNFSIGGVNQYAGYNGSAGTFSFDAGSHRITFKGGSLDGVMPQGFYSIYYAPQGRPTVSFRNAGGAEVAFCQKK
jgi:hypothetical protein